MFSLALLPQGRRQGLLDLSSYKSLRVDIKTCSLTSSATLSLLSLTPISKMQRQSLGSPTSKLQINVAKEQKLEGAENRKGEEDEGDKKADNKLFKSTSRTHKSIHLIPLLIISCFLILYLVSHDPSQKDLVTIKGFEGISLQKDSVKIDDFGRFFEVEKSEISALRSHRSLQEVRKRARRSSPSNLHRKFGNF